MRLPFLLPSILCGYVITAYAMLIALNAGIPRALEPVISFYVLPLFWIFQPLYPVMKPLGFVEGEYFTIPTSIGFVLATGFYASVLALIGFACEKLYRCRSVRKQGKRGAPETRSSELLKERSSL